MLLAAKSLVFTGGQFGSLCSICCHFRYWLLDWYPTQVLISIQRCLFCRRTSCRVTQHSISGRRPKPAPLTCASPIYIQLPVWATAILFQYRYCTFLLWWGTLHACCLAGNNTCHWMQLHAPTQSGTVISDPQSIIVSCVTVLTLYKLKTCGLSHFYQVLYHVDLIDTQWLIRKKEKKWKKACLCFCRKNVAANRGRKSWTDAAHCWEQRVNECTHLCKKRYTEGDQEHQ